MTIHRRQFRDIRLSCVKLAHLLLLSTRGLHREWEIGIPIFPWESRGNENGHSVIREREWEWEMLHGNGREWELTIVAKFPRSTEVSLKTREVGVL